MVAQEQCSNADADQMKAALIDAEIVANKAARRDIDSIIQQLKSLPASAERKHAIHYATNAVMWLGMDLKRLNEPNPYPNSKDPSNTKIEPTADNLKL